jgi:hypothetical protein
VKRSAWPEGTSFECSAISASAQCCSRLPATCDGCAARRRRVDGGVAWCRITLTKERSVAVLCLWVKALHERAQVEEVGGHAIRAAPSVWEDARVRAHKSGLRHASQASFAPDVNSDADAYGVQNALV